MISDFDKIIWREGLTLIDFFATWCSPCRTMHPIIERVQERMRGRLDVYRIDIDNRAMSSITRRYNIRAVPTIIIFRRGEMLWRHTGSISYENLIDVVHQLEVAVEFTRR